MILRLRPSLRKCLYENNRFTDNGWQLKNKVKKILE